MPTIKKKKKKVLRAAKSEANTSVRAVLRRSKRKRRSTVEQDNGPTVVNSNYENKITELLSGNYRSNAFRYGDYIHVSDIIGKCTRMIALSLLYDRVLHGDTIYDASEVTFAIGHACQAALTNKIERVNPDNLYGVWSCPCGGKIIQNTKTKALEEGNCSKCGKSPDKYNELVLTYDVLRLIGSVDITLSLEAALYFVESKSKKKEDWKVLVRPEPDHIIQVVFYWYLAKELGYPVHNRCSIIYIPKEQVRGSPYKEFVIDPLEEMYRLELYLEDARVLAEALNGGELPERICKQPDSTMAKKCEMCSLCFNL